MTIEITDADREAANKAFDIAFQGDTTTIDDDMARLFARHRLAASKAKLEAAERKQHKLSDEIIPDLNNIARAIADEGDRAYFGSTNDADELKKIASWLDHNMRLAKWSDANGCQHDGYNFAEHGRCCSHCGEVLIDFGD